MSDKWLKRWTVQSMTDPSKSYTVAQDAQGNFGCSCPAWEFRKQSRCKHIEEVVWTLSQKTARDLDTVAPMQPAKRSTSDRWIVLTEMAAGIEL